MIMKLTRTSVLALGTMSLFAGSAQALEVDMVVGKKFSSTSSIVRGQRDAVLIDAQMLNSTAQKIVDDLKARNLNLKAVFVTHAHPDHAFGLEVIARAFPNAQILANPAVAQSYREQMPKFLGFLAKKLGDQAPSALIFPEPYSGSSFELDGETIEIRYITQGDTKNTSWFHVPSARTAITGDLVYSNTPAWTADSTPEERAEWLQNLSVLENAVAAMDIEKLIPGHLEAGEDQSPSEMIAYTATYLNVFSAAVSSSETPEEAVEKIFARYPNPKTKRVIERGAKHYFGGGE